VTGKPATMISLLKNPRDRGERLERVQRHLAALGLERYRAIVFGSVARGDFTADSDTDLLVVSDELPVNPKARVDVLFDIRDMAPEIEPIGWREADWTRREAGGDPFIGVLRREGIALSSTRSGL
jgi:predicted nucleotidyltransferase